MKKTIGGMRLLLLFSLTYFVSYLTRNNFSAVVVEVADALDESRSALSLCFTGSFITYGFGQIVSGYFGDRIAPKRLVLYGLLTTTTANVLITFLRDPAIMAVLWSINGLAQAFMWPPLLKLMTSLLTEEEYRKGVVYLNYGGMAGTITVYLMAPVLLSAFGWKGVFFTSALGGVLMIVLWQKFCPKTKIERVTTVKTGIAEANRTPNVSLRHYAILLLLLMVSIVMHGILRDGVMTWVPSYISEVFDMEKQMAILVSVILPVFGMISSGVSGWLHRRYFRNPLTCALVFFVLGLTMTLGLCCLMGRYAFLDVVLLSLLVASMQGANLMLVGMIPVYFKHTGRISLVSGILNSCTYVGSGVSAYGIAVISENKGWTVTIGCWSVIAAIGVLFCLFCLPLWKKQIDINM